MIMNNYTLLQVWITPTSLEPRLIIIIRILIKKVKKARKPCHGMLKLIHFSFFLWMSVRHYIKLSLVNLSYSSSACREERHSLFTFPYYEKLRKEWIAWGLLKID